MAEFIPDPYHHEPMGRTRPPKHTGGSGGPQMIPESRTTPSTRPTRPPWVPGKQPTTGQKPLAQQFTGNIPETRTTTGHPPTANWAGTPPPGEQTGPHQTQPTTQNTAQGQRGDDFFTGEVMASMRQRQLEAIRGMPQFQGMDEQTLDQIATFRAYLSRARQTGNSQEEARYQQMLNAVINSAGGGNNANWAQQPNVPPETQGPHQTPPPGEFVPGTRNEDFFTPERLAQMHQRQMEALRGTAAYQGLSDSQLQNLATARVQLSRARQTGNTELEEHARQQIEGIHQALGIGQGGGPGAGTRDEDGNLVPGTRGDEFFTDERMSMMRDRQMEALRQNPMYSHLDDSQLMELANTRAWISRARQTGNTELEEHYQQQLQGRLEALGIGQGREGGGRVPDPNGTQGTPPPGSFDHNWAGVGGMGGHQQGDQVAPPGDGNYIYTGGNPMDNTAGPPGGGGSGGSAAGPPGGGGYTSPPVPDGSGGYSGGGGQPAPGTPDYLSQGTMPGVDWGGNRPEFLGDMPANMPGPTYWTVTDDMTVQGQMNSIMQTDNPAFQSLREAVMRAHAARGGQNSLMASQAAYATMADLAFNIASQDAATYARSAEFNAAMANQFGLAQQQFIHNALLSDQNFRQASFIQGQQIAGQIAVANIAANAQRYVTDVTLAHDTEMTLLRHEQTLEVLGHNYVYDIGRMGFQGDLDLRNNLFIDTNRMNLDLRNTTITDFNRHGYAMEEYGFQGYIQSQLNDQNFRQQLILDYNNNQAGLAGDFMQYITNMRIQPGMTNSAVQAGMTDIFGFLQDAGFYGNTFWANGMSGEFSSDPVGLGSFMPYGGNWLVFPPSHGYGTGYGTATNPGGLNGPLPNPGDG